MNTPSAKDIEIMSTIGLYIDDEAQVRDEGDVSFSGDWMTIIPINGDVEDTRPARLFAFFEPEQIGGVEDNWNCGIELDGDFWSNDGNWPDCFSTAEEARDCMESYFATGGLLERYGWEVAV